MTRLECADEREWDRRVRNRCAAGGVKIATAGAVTGVRRPGEKCGRRRAAVAVNGVRQIVRLDGAVAVVADHVGAANKGLAALVIEWTRGLTPGSAPRDIVDELKQATVDPGGGRAGHWRLRQRHGRRGHQGRSDLFLCRSRARDNGANELHGSCRADGCDVWVGSQGSCELRRAR